MESVPCKLDKGKGPALPSDDDSDEDGRYSVPNSFSSKAGNVRKRQKRSSDEFKEKQRETHAAKVEASRKRIVELDPERNTASRYQQIRESIPSDVKLRDMETHELCQLYFDTTNGQLLANSLESIKQDSPGLRRIATLPHTMRALLSLSRDPHVFRPDLWPNALTLASAALCEETKPPAESLEANALEADGEVAGGAELDQGSVAAGDINSAQFYTRFYSGKTSTIIQHIEAFDVKFPHYAVRSAGLRNECSKKDKEITISLPYSGIAISSTPAERLQGDYRSRWRMISNWLAVRTDDLETASAYEWQELKMPTASCLDLRLDGDVSAIEFLIVLACKPYSLNSAHGGNGIVSFKQSEELVQCQEKVHRWKVERSLSAHLQDIAIPPEVQARETALRTDIITHYQFMQSVFEELDSDSTGPIMKAEGVLLCAKLAAAIKLDARGHLVEMPAIAKDITREAFKGSANLSWRGIHAGHGPRYERWLRSRAFNIDYPAMDAYSDLTAMTCGPLADLWCIIIIHRDWVIIIVIVMLSRYLLLFRKHGVPLPFFTIQSTKLANIFVSGLLSKCWASKLARPTFDTFMNEPSIKALLAVLPGNMKSLNTFNLKRMTAEFDLDEWEDLVLQQYGLKIGRLARVCIGPMKGQESVILMARHTGNAKYLPQMFPLLQASDELAYAKVVIASELARDFKDDLNSLKTLSAKIEKMAKSFGIESLLEIANQNQVNYYSEMQSLSRHAYTVSKLAPGRDNASLSRSLGIQRRNLKHLEAEGARFSEERINQSVQLLQEIRQAYGRCSALPPGLAILCPKTIIPGSLDHLRFLIEFVNDKKTIVYSAAGYAMSHKGQEGFSDERVIRQPDTGVQTPLKMIQAIVKKPQEPYNRVVGCKGCHQFYLTNVRNKKLFRHTCSASPEVQARFLPAKRSQSAKVPTQTQASVHTSPEAAMDAETSHESSTAATGSSGTGADTSNSSFQSEEQKEESATFESDPSLHVADDQDVQTYLAGIKTVNQVKRALGLDAYDDDPRPGLDSPLLSVYTAKPLPFLIMRDFDADHECNPKALAAVNLQCATFSQLAPPLVKQMIVGSLGERVWADLDLHGQVVWNAGATDAEAFKRQQMSAIATEMAAFLPKEDKSVIEEALAILAEIGGQKDGGDD